MLARLLALALLAAVAAVPAVSSACEGEHEKTMAIGKLTVPELAALLEKKDAKLTVLDANGAATRSKEGVIPGAKLLTSAAKYDAAKELPAAKSDKVVFYCANERCSASTVAAERAVEAGFTDVAILPAGIAGWKQAGKATSQPNS